jgi:hypothetical protein
MRDDRPSTQPDEEPYDLDDDGSYDLEDDEPHDLDDDEPYGVDEVLPLVLSGKAPAGDEAPIELEGEAPVELADEVPTDLDQPVPAREPVVISALGLKGPLDDKGLDRQSMSDEQERQRAIAEVLRDQARREVLREIAYRNSGASLGMRLVTFVLVVAALVVWLVPFPGFGPTIPFPLARQEEETALRLATWVQAQQVEAFRQQRGRLPDVLREAGEPLPGMTYVRIDAGSYRLSGATERMVVIWSGTDTLDTRTRQRVDRLPRVDQ